MFDSEDPLIELLPVFIAIAVNTVLVISIIYFIVLYRKRQENFRKERDHFKQELLKTEIEIREATLTNVSRELHDNLGQIASLAKINLSLVDKDSPEPNWDKLDETKELLRQLMNDMKTISTSLKGENVQHLGLAEMIHRDVERMNKLPKLEVRAQNLQNLPQLDSEKEVFLYRMTQESFNNILKHANATKASIAYRNEKDNRLIIRDNGIGFNQKQQNGNGLHNLKERCTIIGAELRVDSAPDKGTTLTIIF